MSDSYYRRKHTDLVHNLESPKRRWRFFVNWLFDSLMPGVPVVSTAGASSLNSPASIWRGVVFVVFIMGTMAIFASHQAHADYAYFGGTVIDQDGKPIGDATVRVNEIEMQTAENGTFGLHARESESNRYAINISKPGYALIAPIVNQPTIRQFTLKKAYEGRIDSPSKKDSFIRSNDHNSASIKLPAGALIDSDGNAVEESVTTYMYTYNLAEESIPGDMSATNDQNQPVYLESAGAFRAEFIGETTGNKYSKLADGKNAIISVPASIAKSSGELPTLWHYDETTGKWLEKADSVVRINDGRYEGKVDHFSTWNFDWERTDDPACVKYTIDESFFNTYKSVEGILEIQARVISGGTTKIKLPKEPLTREKALVQEPKGEHVIYNIPQNSTVEIYVKDASGEYNILYATENAGGAWSKGKTGIPTNEKDPNHPYDVCNGKITLSTVVIDGSACISGKGKGVPFSWKLINNVPPPLSYENPNATTKKEGSANDVAALLIADMIDKNASGLTAFGSCIQIGGSHTLYVGKAGETDINKMCKVEMGRECSFNPSIKLFTKQQMLSSIKGFLWDDFNNNGLQDSNEEYLQGWTVLLKNPNGSDTSTVTDANGYYEFTQLSITGDYTVFVETRTGVTYTTPQSVVIKVDSVNIPRAVSFGINKTLPKCPDSTCNVSTNGSNGTGNGSKAKPFATIQHGINTAKEGYTVLVHPGTYVENINFNGKNITVKSTDGAEKTIIDGNQNGSVVKFVNGENAQAVLNGFTLTNGNGNYMDIRGDLGYARQGGGIYTDKSNPTVTNLKIVRNKADFGAGIASYISGPMISDTVISDNIATTWGGGIYYSHSTYTDLEKNIVLKNTVVSKNKASGGAGITVNYGSQPILTNVTISENILVSDNPDRVKNDGNNGGAIWRGNKSGVIMSKSIIWNNSSTQIYWAGGDRWTSKISHSDIQGGESGSLITWGDGNIDSDPLFVDARNGDYRLSKNSPAKNMGAYPDTAGTGIPTLSEWGLIIFMLMLTTIGILFTMRRQAMIAATSGGIADGTPPPVLVPAVFIKALTITGLLALIGFAISIWLSSSLPTTTDIVGTLISVPIFAYLIHLLMIFKRQ